MNVHHEFEVETELLALCMLYWCMVEFQIDFELGDRKVQFEIDLEYGDRNTPLNFPF